MRAMPSTVRALAKAYEASQKIRGEPDMIARTIKAVLMANRYLKQNKGEFTKLLAKESGIHDPVVAGLIHEEIIKLYSDTGIVSDEAMHEFIANSKDALKSTREVSFAEIADFSLARKAASEMKESK